MKKFKLIKELPFENSPKLGYISTTIRTDGVHYWNNNWYNPENYPEFWQEIVEKEYEILSFKFDNKILYFDKIENYFIYQPFDGYKHRTLDFLLKNSNTYKIHSVKRLSDGEIFTVGDYVKLHTHLNPCSIDGFYIKNNFLMVTTRESSCGNYLKDCKKVKQPLFTTEDGVEIFEGDEYFRVWNNKGDFKLDSYKCFATKEYRFDIVSKKTPHFSTKKAAEEYILLNKPCLSIKEICPEIGKVNDSSHIDLDLLTKKLKYLVKQKLNL